MIKLVFCLRRLPHLTREEFQRYWIEEHGPLVRSHANALRMKRYIQVHTQESPLNEVLQKGRGGPPPYDGVAELWWDSLEDLIEANSSEEGRKAAKELLEDEGRFIDLKNSPIWIGEENEIYCR